jgi:hypothetical protein
VCRCNGPRHGVGAGVSVSPPQARNFFDNITVRSARARAVTAVLTLCASSVDKLGDRPRARGEPFFLRDVHFSFSLQGTACFGIATARFLGLSSSWCSFSGMLHAQTPKPRTRGRKRGRGKAHGGNAHIAGATPNVEIACRKESSCISDAASFLLARSRQSDRGAARWCGQRKKACLQRSLCVACGSLKLA